MELGGVGARLVQFVEQTDIPVAMLSMLQALPNTALWHRLEQEERLYERNGDGNHIDDQGSLGPVFPVDVSVAEGPHQDHDESDQGKAGDKDGQGPFFGVKSPVVEMLFHIFES